MVLFPAGNASSAGQMSLYLECCSDDKADDPKWHRCVQFGLRIANPSDENAEAYLGTPLYDLEVSINSKNSRHASICTPRHGLGLQ
jgi:hypothetical protein